MRHQSTSDMLGSSKVDAVVIGGGPAGLSAALYLARYNRSVLVFDTGRGRSTHHQVNHNYLGFPQGIATVGLRELARKQLAPYDKVQILHHVITELRGDGERGFTAYAQGHSWDARVIVLATGVLDHFPHFPGWESYVGRSMFWCITCDGYENRGKNILVVGHSDGAAGEAMQLHSLTDKVRLLTNSEAHEISPKFLKRLAAAGIEVIDDHIGTVEGADGVMSAVITRNTGQRIELDSLFSIQGANPETGLARQLGVTLATSGWIEVDTEQKTSVPGVYAAGDVTALHSHQVTAAVHEGAQAASAANYFLYPPELKAD